MFERNYILLWTLGNLPLLYDIRNKFMVTANYFCFQEPIQIQDKLIRFFASVVGAMSMARMTLAIDTKSTNAGFRPHFVA
jgi:hypothetical protein